MQVDVHYGEHLSFKLELCDTNFGVGPENWVLLGVSLTEDKVQEDILFDELRRMYEAGHWQFLPVTSTREIEAQGTIGVFVHSTLPQAGFLRLNPEASEARRPPHSPYQQRRLVRYNPLRPGDRDRAMAVARAALKELLG